MSAERAPGLGVSVVLTCEHGGCEVPPEHVGCFALAKEVLATHRGWDPGALLAARRMSELCGAPLVASTTTRLLVDLNRSLGHQQHFSEFTGALPDSERESIVRKHYAPFRAEVRRLIEAEVAAGRRVLHVSMHSFVDVLDGAQERDLDIGILFDPLREAEVSISEAWRAGIEAAAPGVRVAFNRPYLGIDDGHTTALREVFADPSYAGLEIELRQGFVRTNEAARAAGELLASALARVGAVSMGR